MLGIATIHRGESPLVFGCWLCQLVLLPDYPRQTAMLAVVGAGPKGIAIAAKVPRAARCRVLGASGSGRRPRRGRRQLERSPGIHQWAASAGDATGEGRRLSVRRELGPGIG